MRAGLTADDFLESMLGDSRSALSCACEAALDKIAFKVVSLFRFCRFEY